MIFRPLLAKVRVSFTSTNYLKLSDLFENGRIVTATTTKKTLNLNKQFSTVTLTKRDQGHQENNENEERKWDLWSAVCLNRKPIITQDMTQIEKDYSNFMAQYEFEVSHRSDHEIRHLGDKILLEKLKKGEIDQGTVQTAQDFEDLYTAKLEAFKTASRITEADTKKDTKSLDRALDSNLYLIVEQKLGNTFEWAYPQVKLMPGENLRQGAERALREFLPNFEAKILGNITWGFYKYKYPAIAQKNQNGNVYGAKIFFLKAFYLSGTLDEIPKEKGKNFLWLKKSELKSKVAERYYKSISEFILDE